MGSDPPLVATRALVKTFDEAVALDGVDFDLAHGEIHALLGENGAGKSTLANVLTGIYRADSGVVRVRGAEVQIRSPTAAFAIGIGMVHQHFKLADALTAAENLHIGWGEAPRLARRAKLIERTRELSDLHGLPVAAELPVWQLSVGERQRLEILRVLARGAEVLILDEPTAVLTPDEARQLFDALRALRAAGRSVILITHKLREALAVADRVTVMRRGRIVATRPASAVDVSDLARLMTGGEPAPALPRASLAPANTVLALHNVSALGSQGRAVLEDVSLEVREREIVGVAGVSGSGQAELAEVTAGMRRCHTGRVLLDGVELTGATPRRYAEAGVGHIPEDRLAAALVPAASIRDNAILRDYRAPALCRRGLRRLAASDSHARELVHEADVRGAENLAAPVSHLSGGNQQKLVALREARVARRLLVAVLPTRGLDISAADSIHRRILAKREEGGAILLISEDLDELLALSDRAVVMFGGRIVERFEGPEFDRAAIGRAMAGLDGGPDRRKKAAVA